MKSHHSLPNTHYPLLVIVGPTSSGKSELAVKLAKLVGGEIISCDSRQIYKGMNLGTGKVEGKWQWVPSPLARGDVATASERQRGRIIAKEKIFLYKNIPHHLIDFIDPKRQYSVAMFKQQAQKAINDIIRRGKVPILCGGTGHWIDAVVFDQDIPDVKPNLKLRAQLEKKPVGELYKQLKKLDPRRAATIDRHNPRRLIRALEIVITTGRPVPSLSTTPSESAIRILSTGRAEGSVPARLNRSLHSSSAALGLGRDGILTYDVLWIGINQPQEILYKKIKKRLKQRLDLGMIDEIKKLRRQGLSWKRLESFGLEYKFVSLYLQKKIDKIQMFDQLLLAIQHYAKRQMTWWKRNENIKWISSPAEANKLVKEFLAT